MDISARQSTSLPNWPRAERLQLPSRRWQSTRSRLHRIRIQKFRSNRINRNNRYTSQRIRQGVHGGALLFYWRECALIGTLEAHEIGSRAALREVLLDLRTSKSAAPVSVTGEFQQDTVRSGRKLQCGRSVAQEFFINKDFRAVGLGRNRDGANSIRDERGGSLQCFRRFTIVGQYRWCCGLSSAVVRQCQVGIEAVKNLKKIRRTEGKADARDVLLDEFLRVDPNHFALRVQQRTTTIARIDGRVRLDPRSRTGIGKFSDGADNAFRNAKEHGIAGIADGEHAFPLMNTGRVREGQMGKIEFGGGDFHLGESDV